MLLIFADYHIPLASVGWYHLITDGEGHMVELRSDGKNIHEHFKTKSEAESRIAELDALFAEKPKEKKSKEVK